MEGRTDLEEEVDEEEVRVEVEGMVMVGGCNEGGRGGGDDGGGRG